MSTEKAKALCYEILDAGIKRYPVLVGIVSRIENNNYEIFATVSDTGIFKEGDVYNLDSVYCRDVYRRGETVAITQIDNVRGLKLHPLYKDIPLEVYISSPVMVDGQVWGTLNFSSLDTSEKDFTDDDIRFNEKQAQRIADAISGKE